ncbi:MAG TPA: hypothetical protein VEN81_10245 [Planctomycetota bacterium]|nr:hypothetical protein [Planctomycetota bacterium]
MSRLLPILSALGLAGCLSQVPLGRDPGELEIAWVGDFETARGIAAENARPILLVLVAGERLDRC